MRNLAWNTDLNSQDIEIDQVAAYLRDFEQDDIALEAMNVEKEEDIFASLLEGNEDFDELFADDESCFLIW